MIVGIIDIVVGVLLMIFKKDSLNVILIISGVLLAIAGAIVVISGLKEKALSLFMEDNCLTMSCWFLPSVQFSRLVVSDSL